MSTLTRWFIDNPVAANLMLLFILVSGWLTLGDMRVESFPQTPPSQLIISVTYPGGTAQQVDQGITQRIEDAISGVPGIRSIVSESHPGEATIRVKKKTGTDLTRLMEDIRNQTESIIGFPEQAERPRIYRDEFTNLASFILISGGESDELLQEISGRVERALKRHPEISQVTNLGKRDRELVVEPDSDSLKEHGLNVEALAERVSKWSLEYRTGELKTARGAIILRGDSHADSLLKLQNLPIITNAGATIKLGEIASVNRTFEQSRSIVRFQGKRAIALMISTSPKDNLLHVSDAVQDTLDSLRTTLPGGIELDVMADMAPYITDQIDLLSDNAWQGLLIVVVLLGLFLEFRLAFWVALGIPVSLAGAIWLMGLPPFDYSLNDITLFGMILVLGVLVDDAVVVGESIHSARQRNTDPKQAAWEGVESVSVATVYGVLTTIAAFSPMLWIENELAKVLAGFSAVVIFALFFSLVESKFILPTHLSFPIKPNKENPHSRPWSLVRVRDICIGSLDRFAEQIYQPLLRSALANKGTTFLLFFTFAFLAYGLLTKGNIRAVFFPEIPGRYATALVTMDHDAPFELIGLTAAQLEQAIIDTDTALQKEFDLEEAIIEKHVLSYDDSGEIELNAELSKLALERIPSRDILNLWQSKAGALEGSYAVKFTLADEPAGGTAISISAENRDLAKHVASLVSDDLKRQPGVSGVYNDSQGGSRQLRITLNDRGAQLGIDQRQLAALVGGAFGDMEVHRLLEDGEETRLLVRLPEYQKRTLEQLRETPVHVGEGSFVSLEQISDISFSREPDLINRRNREEVVHLYWRQDKAINSPEAVWRQLSETTLPELQKMYPDVTIKAVGEFDEIIEVQAGFKKAMILTLLLIYVLLAIPLKSYWQPFIIMSVIPFGFAGAIYGHGLLGLPVSLLSMFGMMAMTGVVINDSLVLMTRFNKLVLDGLETKEAVVLAGRSRMRPIFLTTVTTVCGLLPLLSETSEQAQYLKPAAVSLVFGELFATPITLVLIPVLLTISRSKSSSD
jgi:multidrug efflux pump subunit AcrB